MRPSGAADVIAAVGFARSNGLPIAVRGGGHSIAGFSTVDDGLVIDLSSMRDVRVDPVARRAEVGPGATWGEVDHETQAHGLATTGGLVSTTGVAGFTLGGGIGWLMRKHGLACDNLLAADVVTADGQLVHASGGEQRPAGGLRGGGGNFGIVTRFEFGLHPVGPTVYAGLIFFSAEHDLELMRMFRDWAPGAPEDITAVLDLTAAPPLPVVPEAWHGKKVTALVVVSAGPHDEAGSRCARSGGRAGRGPARADALPGDAVAARPVVAEGHQRLLQGGQPGGDRRRADRAVSRAALRDPGPQCEIHLHQMGGAVTRPADGDTAFPERDVQFVANAVTGWQDAGAGVGEAHAEWARAVVDAAGAHPPGARTSTSRARPRKRRTPTARRSTHGCGR